MKLRPIPFLLVTAFSVLFFSVGPVWAKTYRLGVPKGYTAPTYNKLFESLREKGFVPGENLMIVPIDLTSFKTEAGKKRIRHEIAEQCDIFFTTGANLQIIFEVEPKTPLLFRGTYSPQSSIPLTMKANTTGFYWESTTTMFKRTVQLLPTDQRKKLGITFYKGSSLVSRVSRYNESCKKLGIDLVVKSYQGKEDIERVMREFKNEGVTGITLLPAATRKGELAELIKWQNHLKLPLLGQVKSHIEKGVFGGPAVDYELVTPKLAEYTIKLLLGRKPSQLPINFLSRKFIINLNTVNILEINIPQDVIDQAEIVGLASQKQPEKVDLPPLVPGNFVVGTAKNIPNPTLPLLVNALAEWGYVEGKNLRVALIDLNGIGDPQQSRQIAKRIAAETDVFFASGNILARLLQLSNLNTPVCFISTKEIADNIPTSIQHNFTGVIRDSNVSIIEMALKMIPRAKKIGFLAQSESNLHTTFKKLGEIAEIFGLTLESRIYSTPAEIGPAMQELQQYSDFVLLFPPSIKPDDLSEIVKLQNQLLLPVVAQMKNQIKAGLLGGPVVDFEVVLPKLAEFIHKIFHGRKPDKLPIHYTQGKYVINLRAANIINAIIPDEITAVAEIIH